MSFTFQYIGTDSDGLISEQIPVEVIKQSISIEVTVGDEQFLKSGDITLTTREPFTISNPPARDFLAAYWNGSLQGIYHIDRPYLNYDEKSRLYKHRLIAIQNLFFDDLQDTNIVYSADSADWSYELSNAKIIIKEIFTVNPLINAEDVWGFSLGDMILNMAGKSNGKGYQLIDLSTPLRYIAGETTVPALFRDISLDESETEETAVDFTFGDHDIPWMDVFKMALYAYNCYLRATPIIESGILGLDIELIPKKFSEMDSKNVTWLERQRIHNKYRIDGVVINGDNFKFTYENFNSKFVFDKSLEISDPADFIDSIDPSILYWTMADHDPVNGWEIGSIVFGNRAFSTFGDIEDAYDDIISSNDGFTGSILYDNEVVLDELLAGSETVKLNRLSINEEGVAKVEGIVL
jgi:hypothetical protein